ncbi:MAG: hypothetical protein M1821_001594 [Bathelium mastoideum]|nr:MAG: hypothetical protein M1821_001594 [Bathelium mastoideum]
MAQPGDHLLRQPMYVFDLPEELLATLQPKAESSNSSNQTREDEPSSDLGTTQRSENQNAESGTTSATSCALCGLGFADLQEQRSHVRSDLHGYNLRQKIRGLKPVNEAEFEKLVGDLSESISGSDSDDTETDEDERQMDGNRSKESTLSALLKKQANITASEEDEFFSKKRKRGTGKPPLLWFTSPKVPEDTRLGIYRAIFSDAEQQNEASTLSAIRQKQLPPLAPPKPAKELEGGGVAIPKAATQTPHYFLCMIGGGHFAAMVISLAPKKGKSHSGVDERSATVLAHKTFHRYTTRRKQGGSQAANDSAKGAAHSAGSSLRRYNEAALTAEVRQLLSDWKELIDTSELLFIRATGSTNRRTLFGPYDGQVLTHNDPRNRGFPFSTRRATQAELMRSFIELTRVKVSQIDEGALTASQSVSQPSAAVPSKPSPKPAAPEPDPATEAIALHTTQLTALIRRSRAPALLSYLNTNQLPADFRFHPSQHHNPTPLHLSASLSSPACITALLVKAGADPGVRNGEGRTAYEIAGGEGAREAFRVARGELGEAKWDWNAAGVGAAMGRGEMEARKEQAKEEKEREGKAEGERRARELERLREEERKREDEGREKKMGKGRNLGVMAERERGMSAQERREEEGRGMTPEMRMRLERERRARAAEERIRRMAGGGGR